MKPKGTVCGGQPPSQERKRNRLHTAVLTGIAVFFYSTIFFDFLLHIPIYPKLQQKDALAKRRVRFLFVVKCQTPHYFIYFQYGQAVFRKIAAAFLETCTYFGVDKQPLVISTLLCEWQAFIGRYP